MVWDVLPNGQISTPLARVGTTQSGGSFWDSVNNILTNLGGVAQNALGVYATVRDDLNAVNNDNNKAIEDLHTTNPYGLSWSDIPMPNWYLLGGGAILLLIAFAISRR
jgi:hypothetical protein